MRHAICLFVVLSSLTCGQKACSLEEAFAKTQGVAQLALGHGPAVGLYNADTGRFCGALLKKNDAEDQYIIALHNEIGIVTQRAVDDAAVRRILADQPQLRLCLLEDHKEVHKKQMPALGALALAGVLFTLFGSLETYKKYASMREKGEAVKAELAKDIGRCCALMLMYWGVDALGGGKGKQLLLAALATVYSYHSTEHAPLGIAAGLMFAVPTIKSLAKRLRNRPYKSIQSMLKHAQAGAEKRLGFEG